MVKKHSYVINGGLIFCILAEDKEFFYGEIIYGTKKIRGVKCENFGGKYYYKYWQLSDRKKGGNYESYFSKIKRLYPQMVFYHRLMGNLFRIKKDRALRIIPPLKIKDLPKNLISFGKRVQKLLKINRNKIYFSGSILSIKNYSNFGDIDIIIEGLKSNIKASKIITILSNRKEFSLEEENFNRRRFKFDGKAICPFGISKKDNFFERNFIRKGKEEKIIAEVIDNSLSLLSPAVYKINIMGEVSYLISYNVGHTHFLRMGEKIEFNAPKCYFNNKKIPFSYVIPIEGSWIKILSS
jgi:hypothetical protein